ncbi:MAG: hypothetical protein ABSA58_07780 [Acetobacteraceae bacterium]
MPPVLGWNPIDQNRGDALCRSPRAETKRAIGRAHTALRANNSTLVVADLIEIGKTVMGQHHLRRGGPTPLRRLLGDRINIQIRGLSLILATAYNRGSEEQQPTELHSSANHGTPADVLCLVHYGPDYRRIHNHAL